MAESGIAVTKGVGSRGHTAEGERVLDAALIAGLRPNRFRKAWPGLEHKQQHPIRQGTSRTYGRRGS